jgi:hypothetical protein
MHLPIQNGYYWVLEDIGISCVRCVCWVAVFPEGTKFFPEAGVYLISPWSVYNEPLADSPEFHHKQWIKWNPSVHLAWKGPLPEPEILVNVKAGEYQSWRDLTHKGSC